MTQYIIKSPKAPSNSPQYATLGVNGTVEQKLLGTALTLTRAEVEQLTANDYNCIQLDGSGLPAPSALSLADDAADAAPAVLSQVAPANGAATTAVTHDVPTTPSGFGRIDVFRKRAGTVTKVKDAVQATSSPQTVTLTSNAIPKDDHHAEGWFGGSARKIGATVYTKHVKPVVSATINADTDVDGTSNAADDGETVTLYVAGVAVGTAVTAAGAWTVAYNPSTGNVLTAVIGAGTNYASITSDPVTVAAS